MGVLDLLDNFQRFCSLRLDTTPHANHVCMGIILSMYISREQNTLGTSRR
jgi:hypothetical protein